MKALPEEGTVYYHAQREVVGLADIRDDYREWAKTGRERARHGKDAIYTV